MMTPCRDMAGYEGARDVAPLALRAGDPRRVPLEREQARRMRVASRCAAGTRSAANLESGVFPSTCVSAFMFADSITKRASAV